MAEINITRLCTYCSISFISKGESKNRRRKFCSAKCRIDFFSVKGNHPSWKGGLLKSNCQTCNKKLFVKPSHIRLGKGKFCSRKCMGNGNRPNKKIERICIICSTSKFVKPSQLKNGVGTYCSRICMGIGQSKINVKVSYSRTKQGRRTDLNNQFFRSTWEANYARYLHWLVRNSKIKHWEYESDVFEFPIKCGSYSYRPDFKVINLDDSVEYHEIKGWMDIKSKAKLDAMKTYHPEIELILIDEPVYIKFANEFSKVIPNWE